MSDVSAFVQYVRNRYEGLAGFDVLNDTETAQRRGFQISTGKIPGPLPSSRARASLRLMRGGIRCITSSSSGFFVVDDSYAELIRQPPVICQQCAGRLLERVEDLAQRFLPV